MTRLPLALAALLALSVARAQETPPAASPEAAPASPAAAAPAAAPAPEPQRPGARIVPRGAVLEEVAGTLEAIDRSGHRLTIGTASGPVSLGVDRNTMVYTGAGLGTVRDLVPGLQLRAGRNAEFLAYWVQVRPVPSAPTSTPGQGTGPAGAAGPPAEGGSPSGAPAGGAAGPSTTGPPGGGSVNAGPPAGTTTPGR
jgi:hypothetical protein